MNIAIVDDHKLLGELIKTALSTEESKNEIVVYNSPLDFLSAKNNNVTDVLITDIMMPEMSGLDLIGECKKRVELNNLAVIVLSSIMDPATIKEAVLKGADAYLAKDSSIEELKAALKFVTDNPKRPLIGDSLKEILLESNFYPNEVSLSPRERSLLKLICEGNTIKEIASIEALSINTIQSYMKTLMRKMQVNRTPDLILKAIKTGQFMAKIDFK